MLIRYNIMAVVSSFILILICIVFLALSPLMAGDFRMNTASGEITRINNGVITLDKKDVFYPAMEITIPDWAVVGATIGLSYSNEGKKNCYYEIIKPGGEFQVKEELERVYNDPK